MAAYFSAGYRHRLFSPNGYDIPKPKFLYYVSFVTDKLDTNLLRNVSFFIKRIDRIQMNYEVQEMNQYNKRRLVQTHLQYGPLTFTLYDTVDETALKLVHAYNQFYYGDFQGKNNRAWSYDITGGAFEPSPNWGLQNNFTGNNQYFFDRIEVYEIYDQTYTQTNFINPKFVAVDFQNLDSEAGIGNEVNITCKYEGIVVEKVNAIITPQIAAKFGLPYVNDFGLGLNGLRIPGLDPVLSGLILNTAVGTLQAAIPGLAPTIDIISSLTGGNNSVVGVVGNEVFGNPIGIQSSGLLGNNILFDTFNEASVFLPGISTRASSGEVVRDISTAVILSSISNSFGS